MHTLATTNDRYRSSEGKNYLSIVDCKTMRGTIFGYNSTNKTGVIKGENEQRYQFTASDYLSENEIKIGQKVDFVEGEDNQAKDIYLEPNSLTDISNTAQQTLDKTKEVFGNTFNQENFNKLKNSSETIAKDILQDDRLKKGTKLVKTWFIPVLVIGVGIVGIKSAIEFGKEKLVPKDYLLGKNFLGVITRTVTEESWGGREYQREQERQILIKFMPDKEARLTESDYDPLGIGSWRTQQSETTQNNYRYSIKGDILQLKNTETEEQKFFFIHAESVLTYCLNLDRCPAQGEDYQNGSYNLIKQ